MKTSDLNNFKREHFDLHYKPHYNVIAHDSNTTSLHRKYVVDVCEWAHLNGMDFFTRAILKTGKIVDVVIPELPYPFVEIRDSEKKKHKHYLDEHRDKIVFIDVDDPFKLK